MYVSLGPNALSRVDPKSPRAFQNTVHHNSRHARSQKAGCYLTWFVFVRVSNGPYFYAIQKLQLLPNSEHPKRVPVASLTSTCVIRALIAFIGVAKHRSACEPGTTNLIPLTEIAVSLPLSASSHSGHRPPSLHGPFLSDFSD